LYYEQRVNSYAAVNYNAHPEAPEDHLATNLRAAWAKAGKYYSKLDNSPAHYVATILHPYYKHYLDQVWSDKPDWIAANNSIFCVLWVQYNTLPRAVRPLKVISNDMDEAIDAAPAPATMLARRRTSIRSGCAASQRQNEAQSTQTTLSNTG
jgi:hypothetical protein